MAALEGPARTPERGPRRATETEQATQGGHLRNPTRIEPTMRRTILACNCGELLVVLGGEDEWRSERPAVFECGACAAKITLPEDEGRGPEEVDYHALSLGELVKMLKPRYG